MNAVLLAAAVLTLILGIVHSVMGEVLIFQPLAKSTAAGANPPIAQRHINILWATWHLASVFGWALAAILCALALNSAPPAVALIITRVVAVAMFSTAAIVLIGTRGRHPGWIVMLVIAMLICLA
jgi:hypothetical protein